MDDGRSHAPPTPGAQSPPAPGAQSSAAPGSPGTAPARATGGLSLPPVATYLRLVIALGLGSLRAGLAGIAFLYFYRLGMGIYIEYAQGSAAPFGVTEAQAMTARVLMEIAAYLPLLVLIYTPFLPLQDALLRGERPSFFDSMKHVLEVFGRFIVSILAQGILVVGPPMLLVVGVALLLAPMPTAPEEIRALIALGIMIPSGVWATIVMLLFLFATPLVVLDGGHPLGALGRSASLVRRSLGGILGRLIVFGLLIVLASIFLSLPDAFMEMTTRATGIEHPAVRLARVIWSSGVSAFLFPFSIAALMVLYRGLVPRAGAGSGGTIEGAPGAEPAKTPFIFE